MSRRSRRWCVGFLQGAGCDAGCGGRSPRGAPRVLRAGGDRRRALDPKAAEAKARPAPRNAHALSPVRRGGVQPTYVRETHAVMGG